MESEPLETKSFKPDVPREPSSPISSQIPFSPPSCIIDILIISIGQLSFVCQFNDAFLPGLLTDTGLLLRV
jgi:hypothetical protein